MISHYTAEWKAASDVRHAFAGRRPDGSKETITPSYLRRMSRRELRERLSDDPAFERWYRNDMHRRAFDALTFYLSWRGWIVLKARRLSRVFRFEGKE